MEQDAYADFILQLPLNQANRDSLLDIRLQKEPPKFRISWKDGDPSPDDKTNEIQDWEFDKKRNKSFNFYLNDYEKDELKRRQVYYQLYGGIIGSGKEIPLDTNIIIIDLNIVYDRDQYTLQEAIESTKIPVEDMKGAYSRINVEFNVTYSAGKGDPSYVNSDGAYGKIAEGFKNKAINVLLFVNNQYRGHKGSLYNWRTQQIFAWEGTSAAKPITKKNVVENLSSTSIGHELGHLFLHFAGDAINESLVNNFKQDIGINYALNQMRYNPLFFKDSELPDDFDYNKMGIPMTDSGITTRKSASNPTYEQLLRIGAKRVAKHF